MLNFRNVALRRGPKRLFEDATFTVHAGHKVAVTGANGVGKSSLLALVRGELQPDAGELTHPPGLVVAHVAQEAPDVELAAVDYVMQGDAELWSRLAALRAAESAGDGTRQARLHTELESVDGYRARSRAARLMRGLGFAPAQEHTPVRTLSGGWRRRLNLAQALMCRSDLLLLDEPTNHLDLDAVIWLEEWLRAYAGTLLLIAHDREFLDRVVDHVLHIEGGRATLERGDYSTFERHRAERLALQQAQHEKQQREVARIQRFVERFRAKASKARQVQSRVKALSALQRVAPAHVDSPFRFSFRAPERLPHPLLRLEEAAAGYGERAVVRGVRLGLAPGDRLGLLGANGAGKSTLVKLLAGVLPPCEGTREPAPDLRVGYFAQHQLEQLAPRESPLAHLQHLDPCAGDKALRDFLGGFGFSGDAALEPVAPRSGGERSRLVLALIVYQRPNLLLLDEPTNHLDLEMRHALSLALQEFEGAVVVVSHDRHLLRTTCDALMLVADGEARPFDGDLDDYARRLAASREQPIERTGTSRPDGRRAQRQRDAEHRRQLQPLRQRVARLEEEIERLQAAQRRLQARLADPGLYQQASSEELQALMKEGAQLDDALRRAEEDWVEASEALETARPAP